METPKNPSSEEDDDALYVLNIRHDAKQELRIEILAKIKGLSTLAGNTIRDGLEELKKIFESDTYSSYRAEYIFEQIKRAKIRKHAYENIIDEINQELVKQ